MSSSTSFTNSVFHTPPKTKHLEVDQLSETKELINDIILFPTPKKKKNEKSKEIKNNNNQIDTPKKQKLKSTIKSQREIIKNKRSTIIKLRKNIKLTSSRTKSSKKCIKKN